MMEPVVERVLKKDTQVKVPLPSEIYLNISEEDADNSTELMPEECTSSSHDKKQLPVNVFNAQFDLMKVSRPITLSLSNHVDGYK